MVSGQGEDFYASRNANDESGKFGELENFDTARIREVTQSRILSGAEPGHAHGKQSRGVADMENYLRNHDTPTLSKKMGVDLRANQVMGASKNILVSP